MAIILRMRTPLEEKKGNNHNLVVVIGLDTMYVALGKLEYALRMNLIFTICKPIFIRIRIIPRFLRGDEFTSFAEQRLYTWTLPCPKGVPEFSLRLLQSSNERIYLRKGFILYLGLICSFNNRNGRDGIDRSSIVRNRKPFSSHTRYY